VSIEPTALQLKAAHLSHHLHSPQRPIKTTHQLQAVHAHLALPRTVLPQRIKEHIWPEQLRQVQLLLQELTHRVSCGAPLVQRLEVLHNGRQVDGRVFRAFPLVLPSAGRLLLHQLTEKFADVLGQEHCAADEAVYGLHVLVDPLDEL